MHTLIKTLSKIINIDGVHKHQIKSLNLIKNCLLWNLVSIIYSCLEAVRLKSKARDQKETTRLKSKANFFFQNSSKCVERICEGSKSVNETSRSTAELSLFFFFSTHNLFRQITVNNNRVNNFAPSSKIEKKFITLCIMPQNGQTHFRYLPAFVARFLKCAWPIWGIMDSRVIFKWQWYFWWYCKMVWKFFFL